MKVSRVDVSKREILLTEVMGDSRPQVDLNHFKGFADLISQGEVETV